MFIKTLIPTVILGLVIAFLPFEIPISTSGFSALAEDGNERIANLGNKSRSRQNKAGQKPVSANQSRIQKDIRAGYTVVRDSKKPKVVKVIFHPKSKKRKPPAAINGRRFVTTVHTLRGTDPPKRKPKKPKKPEVVTVEVTKRGTIVNGKLKRPKNPEPKYVLTWSKDGIKLVKKPKAKPKTVKISDDSSKFRIGIWHRPMTNHEYSNYLRSQQQRSGKNKTPKKSRATVNRGIGPAVERNDGGM